MKKAESSHLDTLEALLAEKRKLEGYLAKLEERRAGTPEHVFARLRDEYLTKLTDAQVRAAAEAESLSGGLESDEAEVREVEAKLKALEEERIEGELRAAVGEFEPKAWEKKQAALAASIAEAEAQRAARLSVFERTRSLLAEARGKLPADERTELPPAAEGPSAPPEPASAPPAQSPPRPRTSGAMAGGPNFDDLAFLDSVVGRSSTPTPSARPIIEAGSAPLPRPIADGPSAKQPAAAAPTAPPAEAASAPAPAPAPRPATPAAPPQAQLPLTEPASPPVPPSPAPPSPPTPAPEAASRSAAAPAAEPAEDVEEESAPSALGRPTPRTSQAIKTLKCSECGSLNYPTEWYCERCGGELAAL